MGSPTCSKPIIRQNYIVDQCDKDSTKFYTGRRLTNTTLLNIKAWDGYSKKEPTQKESNAIIMITNY